MIYLLTEEGLDVTDMLEGRIVAASLIPLTVAPFAGAALNPVMDAVLCGTLVIHSHMGFQFVMPASFPNLQCGAKSHM